MIHGTNKPYSIGTYSTHGCIRMYPEDIKFLFDKVKVWTIVQVVNEPIRIGCRGENLYIEATPSQEQKLQLDLFGKVMMNPDLDLIKTKIINQYNNIDKNVLDEALQRFQGIPIKINWFFNVSFFINMRFIWYLSNNHSQITYILNLLI